jgi:hypothetical protein
MATTFFIPGASSPQEAEMVLVAIAKFAQRPIPPPHECIRRIAYTHNGELYTAEVGQPIDPYYQTRGPIIAILGGDPLLICTPDRGVLRGEPIYVGAAHVKSAVYFDEEAVP